MSWYFAVLGKYAVFTGRARRKEYWMFMLFNMIFSIVAVVADNLLGTIFNFGNGYYETSTGYGWIYLLYTLAVLIPGLSVFVRRMHDIGKSGWWFFIFFIPIIGWIWVTVLLCKDSNFGDNKYGASPKNSTMVPKKIVNDMEYDLNKPITNFSSEKTTVKKLSSQQNNDNDRSEIKKEKNVTINEEKLYEKIWQEIEANKTDVGLWAKCFADCEGDENKTKALYVNKRVTILKENMQMNRVSNISGNQHNKSKSHTYKHRTIRCSNCGALYSGQKAGSLCKCGLKLK